MVPHILLPRPPNDVLCLRTQTRFFIFPSFMFYKNLFSSKFGVTRNQEPEQSCQTRNFVTHSRVPLDSWTFVFVYVTFRSRPRLATPIGPRHVGGLLPRSSSEHRFSDYECNVFKRAQQSTFRWEKLRPRNLTRLGWAKSETPDDYPSEMEEGEFMATDPSEVLLSTST